MSVSARRGAVRTDRWTFAALACGAALIATVVLGLVCRAWDVPLDGSQVVAIFVGMFGGVIWMGDALGLTRDAGHTSLVPSLMLGRSRK